MKPSGHALMVARSARPRHETHYERPPERTWFAPGGRSGSYAELFPGPPAPPPAPAPESTGTRKLRERRRRASGSQAPCRREGLDSCDRRLIVRSEEGAMNITIAILLILFACAYVHDPAPRKEET